jgi:hypothetical protein
VAVISLHFGFGGVVVVFVVVVLLGFVVVVVGGFVVVVAAGVVLAGVVEATGLVAVAVPAVTAPAGLDPAEFTPEVGVDAGGLAGKVVIGVGSGGRGFDKILAIISFRPVSDLFLYLYQVARLSIHSFLAA